MRRTAELTCREMVDFLSDHLAGALPPDVRAVFEAHLRACPDCVAYLDGFRATVRLVRACGPDDPVPADVPEGLVRAILAARPAGRR